MGVETGSRMGIEGGERGRDGNKHGNRDGDGTGIGRRWGWRWDEDGTAVGMGRGERDRERSGNKDESGTEDGVGNGDRDWDKDRDGNGTEIWVELSPSHTCSTRERNNHYQLLPFLSQTLPRATESLPCTPCWGCCHFFSVVRMSTEPMQSPAPSYLPSPAVAPTSRHIPFLFAFPGGPLIELSRSISVAAAAVIRRLCGRAGTRLGPRSGILPAPGSGAAIPNLP